MAHIVEMELSPVGTYRWGRGLEKNPRRLRRQCRGNDELNKKTNQDTENETKLEEGLPYGAFNRRTFGDRVTSKGPCDSTLGVIETPPTSKGEVTV